MQIDGSHTFAVPPETVFAALVDPELIASTLPGVHDFHVESPNHWRGNVRLPVGPRVAFTFELVERVDPSRARLLAKGKTFGGSAQVDTAFDLEPTASGGTLMHYSAHVTLSGLLGRLGDGALKPVGKHQVAGVMRALERRFGEPGR